MTDVLSTSQIPGRGRIVKWSLQRIQHKDVQAYQAEADRAILSPVKPRPFAETPAGYLLTLRSALPSWSTWSV